MYDIDDVISRNLLGPDTAKKVADKENVYELPIIADYGGLRKVLCLWSLDDGFKDISEREAGSYFGIHEIAMMAIQKKNHVFVYNRDGKYLGRKTYHYNKKENEDYQHI